MNLMAYDPFISEKRAVELGVKLATVNEIAKSSRLYHSAYTSY